MKDMKCTKDMESIKRMKNQVDILSSYLENTVNTKQADQEERVEHGEQENQRRTEQLLFVKQAMLLSFY